YVTIKYFASFNDALTNFASSDQATIFSATKDFETKTNIGSMADKDAQYCRLQIGITGKGTLEFAEPLLVKNKQIGPYSIDDATLVNDNELEESCSKLPLIKLNGDFSSIDSGKKDSVN